MLNKFVGIGRLTDEPAVKSSGVFFTLAIHESKEHTTYIDCSAWGKVAQHIQNFYHKGDLIVLEGKLNTYNKEYEIVEYVENKPVKKKLNIKKQVVQALDVKTLAINKKNKENANEIASEPALSGNAKSIADFI